MQQASIFEYMYPEFHFSKPIRMIELFAGYGSPPTGSASGSKGSRIPIPTG